MTGSNYRFKKTRRATLPVDFTDPIFFSLSNIIEEDLPVYVFKEYTYR